MWEIIRDLVVGGVTIFLATQYLEEADQLAGQIAVLDHGRIVEIGRHDELLALDGYYASLYQKQQLEEELAVAG